MTSAKDVEAMWHLLYGHAIRGLAVLDVMPTPRTTTYVAVSAADRATWVETVLRASAAGARVRARPQVYSRPMRRKDDQHLYGWQNVLTVRWASLDVVQLVRVAQLGGAIVTVFGREVVGIIPLHPDAACWMQAYQRLGEQVARSLCAMPFDPAWRVPIAGLDDARFLTDVSGVADFAGVDRVDLEEAGLLQPTARNDEGRVTNART